MYDSTLSAQHPVIMSCSYTQCICMLLTLLRLLPLLMLAMFCMQTRCRRNFIRIENNRVSHVSLFRIHACCCVRAFIFCWFLSLLCACFYCKKFDLVGICTFGWFGWPNFVWLQYISQLLDIYSRWITNFLCKNSLAIHIAAEKLQFDTQTQRRRCCCLFH